MRNMSTFNKTQRPDRIEVHTPEILDEIVADNARNETLLKENFARRCSRPRATSVSATKSHHTSSTCSRLSMASAPPGQLRWCRIQSWLNEDSVRDVQEKSDKESKSVRNICTAVLDNEDAFVHNVDRFLENADILNENRRQMLFKKWSERVYTPLMRKINIEMNSSNFKHYERRKRDLYEKYLEYRNKKGMVFLDVFSPDEYDPLQLNNQRPGPLKAKVHHLDDPLQFQDSKRISEEQDTTRCRTGQTIKAKEIRDSHLPVQPLVPLGREKTNSTTWLRMPIHDIDSPPRLKSRQRMNRISNNSQIDFERWKRTRSNPQLVDLELHCQKKRQYPEKRQNRPVLEWPELPRTQCSMLPEAAY